MPDTDSAASKIPSVLRQSPIRWLILGGVLLIAAIAIGAIIIAGNFRERALYNAERELQNTVLLLARHFDQQLDDFLVVERDLIGFMQANGITSSRENYRRQMSGRDMHLVIKSKMDAQSHTGGVRVFDAAGNLINGGGPWPMAQVNVADRRYFERFKSNPLSPDILVELMLSRITGVWTVVIAHKVVSPDGEFLGVISRGIEPVNFEKFFSTIAMARGAAIAMYHSDGTLVARYPHVDGLIGRNFKAGPDDQKQAFEAAIGVPLTSPINGKDRLIASYALTTFPLVISATTTTEAALADWREQIATLIAIAGGSATAIAGFLFLVVRKLSQQHRQVRQRLRLEKQRLDTAINNMAQGLLLFDSSRRLIICNERYIEMYGLSPDVVKPGCTLHDVIAHRKATGSFDGDVEHYAAQVLRDIDKRSLMVITTSDGRSIQVVTEPLADGGWVATHEDVTERRRAEERITRLAHYDGLTNLPNRALFRQQLRHELRHAAPERQVAVLYIDVDEFKGINDSLGHMVGDELLKSVGNSLAGCVRGNDFVARLGGDEFAVVQTGVESEDDVANLVGRIYQAIRTPYECAGHQVTTDASIGIALAPQHGSGLDEILKNADLAMYAAKAAGRRTWRFFKPEMDAEVQARRMLETDLRQAIAAGTGLEVHYQPCLGLQDDRITGCEALVRWRHPTHGMISPADFVPIAEDTGLINQLGEWVLTTACAEAATWPDTIRLAVNVSPVQLKSGTLALKVLAALASSRLPADRLELEITEAVLIGDDEAALESLHQLREIGVRIALDDFGTGYSSLSYLQRFPFDKIKIDRCFVADIVEPEGSSCIVEAVVNIANARHITTTAEGVETAAQRQLLRELGCSEMQGYLFSAAIPAAEIRRLLLTHRESPVDAPARAMQAAGSAPRRPLSRPSR